MWDTQRANDIWPGDESQQQDSDAECSAKYWTPGWKDKSLFIISFLDFRALKKLI